VNAVRAAAAVVLMAVLACLGDVASISAQRGRAASTLAPRAAAPIDLTGYWVSVVTEDWLWRMVTPKKGDTASVPLNPEGRQVAGLWDAAKDEAAGEQCKAYGAAGVMRLPGRLHITWADDDTLRIDTDAGAQTRLLHFGAPPGAPPQPSWQGLSLAQWEFPAGRGGGTTRQSGAPTPGGGLRVVTRSLRAGYLRRNGVPYSANAVLTEHFHRFDLNDDSWLLVITRVEDPQYLNEPFLTSTHFRRLPDASGWAPAPCAAR
jgi:hypothetical protein